MHGPNTLWHVHNYTNLFLLETCSTYEGKDENMALAFNY